MKWIFKFYNTYISKEKHFTQRVKSLVGFTPVNLTLFRLAFSHKSGNTIKAYAIQNNERLEYLGDAILGTIVAEYLFKKYPEGDEGFLTKMRSKIVKRQSLNKVGDQMGLDELLNDLNNTRLSRSMLGNAVEALIGAIYLEKGYDYTSKYVIKIILRNYIDVHELESFDDNYKSQLLEFCQKKGQAVNYKLVARYKLEKRDRFKVAVLVDGERISTADDYNKKSAEQTASHFALKKLGVVVNGEKEDRKKRKPATAG